VLDFRLEAFDARGVFRQVGFQHLERDESDYPAELIGEEDIPLSPMPEQLE
jgi:hypothetical protein